MGEVIKLPRGVWLHAVVFCFSTQKHFCLGRPHTRKKIRFNPQNQFFPCASAPRQKKETTPSGGWMPPIIYLFVGNNSCDMIYVSRGPTKQRDVYFSGVVRGVCPKKTKHLCLRVTVLNRGTFPIEPIGPFRINPP